MSITIGIPSALFYRPLAESLASSGPFTVVSGNGADIARQFRERHLDAAIISPVDFGKDSSEYCIIRNGMVISSAPTNTVSLHFQNALHRISTVAVHPADVSEIVLVRILLAEEFDVNPSFVPVTGSVIEMLTRADGALLTGDESRVAAHENRLDLVEAWTELTGLPFVHGMLCTRESIIPADELSAITSALRNTPAQTQDEQTVQYLSAFGWTTNNDAVEALREFLHYAYYHGILPDVGEIRVLPSEESETPAPFSVN